MANVRGKGGLGPKNLIVIMDPKFIVYGKNEAGVRDPKEPIQGYYLDVQLDQSFMKLDNIKSGSRVANTNPHLASYKSYVPVEGGKPIEYTKHEMYYSASQYDTMLEVAKAGNGHRGFVTEVDGKTVLGVNAPLTYSVSEKLGKQLVVKTADKDGNSLVKHSNNFSFGKNILEKQDARTEAAREVRNANIEAAKAERQVVQEKEAPATAAEVEIEEPEI